MAEPYDEKDFDQAQDLVKQRQRYFRRPKKSAEVLSRLMARKGYAQTESKNKLEAAWKASVGREWESKSRTAVIRNGILEIIVSSSAVNQQLEFKKRKLLVELQNRLPQNNIKDLRFRVGDIS